MQYSTLWGSPRRRRILLTGALRLVGFGCIFTLACSGAGKGAGPSKSLTGGTSGGGGVFSFQDAANAGTGGAGGFATSVGSGGFATGGRVGVDTGGAPATATGGAATGGVGGVDDPGGVGGSGGGGMPDAGGIPMDASQAAGFLHVEGNQLLDNFGRTVRLTGVNWFGFETSNESPHGTWARDYRSMLKQIRDVGFNSVRLPWSNAILRPDAKANSVNTSGTDPYDGTTPMNQDLAGKTPLEMFDLVIAAAGEVGLKMILDNHSREPDGYMNEKVWYTAKTSEAQWIADWVMLAKRYSGNSTVVAFDLDNEPHGKPTDGGSTWGTGIQATDWNSAAERCGNAILAANPDVLIVVEGVEMVGTDDYWWGGNLSGVHTSPIKLIHPEKLVYSAHEYGPEVFNQTWFTAATFPSNLASIWSAHFDFVMQQKLGHVLIGEFGIKDPTAYSGTEGKWLSTLLGSLGSTYSWTYWCWNPNSGDTGGILQDDWLTPQKFKMDALRPYLAPMIGK